VKTQGLAVANVVWFRAYRLLRPYSLAAVNGKKLGLQEKVLFFKVSGEKAYMGHAGLEHLFIDHTPVAQIHKGKYTPESVNPVSCRNDMDLPALDKLPVVFRGLCAKRFSRLVLVRNFRGIYANIAHLPSILQYNGIAINHVFDVCPFTVTIA